MVKPLSKALLFIYTYYDETTFKEGNATANNSGWILHQ